ncbi:peptidoglycan editing factor PgeF [Actinomycetes bacterium NPDC127524]
MREPFQLKNQQSFTIESWNSQHPGLIAGFTTKNGGAGKGHFQSLNMGFHVGEDAEDTAANRRILARQIDFPISRWIGAEQTHETALIKAKPEDAGKGAAEYESSFKRTDGFFTRDKNILLTLCFADCVPLYFIAPKHGMVGAAHAGWKGTVGGIAKNMAEAWKEEGISPEDIFAVIGPSICKECYKVDSRVMDKVQKLLEENDEKPYNLISEGQYKLDLKELNKIILMKAGVPGSQIEVSSYCTSCDSDLFFSHRRDNGKTGRLMSFIGWKED